MTDLFADSEPRRIGLGPGAVLLRGFANDKAEHLLEALQNVIAVAPFRNFVTPGGHTMSVAMSNCGNAGWVSDRSGYRYDRRDPSTQVPWPAMPDVFTDVARRAAAEAGFDGFAPDACLINRYEPGTRLTLHQDRNERNFGAPIVSVSLGLPAKFLFGGLTRTDKVLRLMLEHGDVAVWGGPSRLAFHGVDVLKDGVHPATGRCRINLTFREAL
ncbi:DNA oxidative demethylase AlkB [Hyphomicrobium sp.]|uniref:DNA oxidative demethylase AlkB n=1 Tax=Hyphomicrobium sp. TaxID=82 RepID=UPI000FA73182|nr:DNA oxidative demethylase AlkB [Hyphomicrobium sp.]RUP10699.1 MAG: DNA oxidative demethylase AlkB [Hyphomicrobium sp.]